MTTLGEYERRLHRFETYNDGFILPDLHLIIRVDGKNFGELHTQIAGLVRPFDERVRDAMLLTARHLMVIGYRVAYAVTQSDEISLYLDLSENNGTRRRSKLITLFASEAALAFSQALNTRTPFHAKIIELPTKEHVTDYFLWRHALVKRNCVTDILTQLLLRQGLSTEQAAKRTTPLDEEGRFALLSELGAPYQALPAWQKYGCAVWWEKGTDNLVQSNSLAEQEEKYKQFLLERISGPAVAYKQSNEPPLKSAAANSSAPEQSASHGIKEPFRIATNAKSRITVRDS